ncbi:MAG TPA: hypothetical protein VK699_18540 [Terriglobales bacterium]|jgi:hypothetical protein|nr:hypothetical protein [Terriglobales bacterium]
MLSRSGSHFSYFAQFVYALLAVLCLSPVAGATSYFVDCNGGSDGNPGTSQSAAWQTLAPVNATQFAPGDSILFLAGCTWTGTLHPGGSGTNGNTITIDKYGTGALPHIDGGGATEAVLLSGQQYWDINNLEVSNSAATAGTRRGVLVTTTGVSNHIHLVGLNVHNISGQLGTDATSKNTGGIGFESTGGAGASFDDILIQNCTIAHADDVGIYLSSDSGTDPRSASWSQAKWNNVVMQGNQLNDIGKNAIIIRVSDTPLIENNVINGAATRLHGNAIFTIGTLNAVIQFNEVYNTALTGYSGLEDSAFDPDNDSLGTLIQYNYSHNNAGGLANPNMIPGTGNYSDGTIIRYNVSQNDVNEIIPFSGAATNTQIYNNTIYIGASLSPAIFSAHLWGGTGGWANNTTYSNNIIYNAGSGTYSLGSTTNNTFSANLFFGSHPASEPADPKKITTNPLLVNPGSGGTGMNTLNGYKLQSGSPARGSGVVISNNGGRDFFGTPLPAGAPDRGAAQFISDYSLAISNSPLTIFPGQTAVFNGTLTTANGYNNTVNLSCGAGQPATCTLLPTSQTPTSGGAAFQVKASDVIVNDYNFNVQGVGTDSLQTSHAQAVTLHIVDFNLTAPSPSTLTTGASVNPTTTPAAGFQVSVSGTFSGTVNLSCSGLPAGASCSFSPSAALSFTGAGSQPVTVSITVAANTAAGVYNGITVSANTAGAPAAKSQSFTLQVVDFSQGSPSPNPVAMTQSSVSQPIQFTLTPIAGFTGPITLSCSALAGVSCQWSPSSPVTIAGSAVTETLTVTTNSAAAGSPTLNIQSSAIVNGVTLSHSQPLTLNIVAGTVTDLSIASLTSQPDPAEAGEPVTINVTAHNTVANANNVVVSLTFPQTLMIVSATLPAACSVNNGIVTCTVGALNAGQNSTPFAVQVIPVAGRNLPVTATVGSSSVNDSNLSNNTQQVTMHIRFRPFARRGLVPKLP